LVEYKVLIKTQRKEDEHIILKFFGDIGEWITAQMPDVNIGNVTVLPMAGIGGGLSFTVSGATKTLKFLGRIIELLPSFIYAITGYLVTTEVIIPVATEVIIPAAKGSLPALAVVAVAGLLILRQ
tara:strand:- start:1012 stop:1386 length:375 start_codon:yes stop_codon:yes gene_type:complete